VHYNAIAPRERRIETMTSYIRLLRSPFEEPYHLDLRITASNGHARGSLQFYVATQELAHWAEGMETFPVNARMFCFGSTVPNARKTAARAISGCECLRKICKGTARSTSGLTTTSAFPTVKSPSFVLKLILRPSIASGGCFGNSRT
jgi:hypothetical protein